MEIQTLKARIYEESVRLGELLLKNNFCVCTAESCTGGMISCMLTEISGASNWFDRAFITYTNKAKHEMLGVKEDTLNKFGAVSEETVKEMSLGALLNSDSNIAVAVSGIAGPTGGTEDKPVGTVWLSWAINGKVLKTSKEIFKGDRNLVRLQTVVKAVSEMNKIMIDLNRI